MGDMTSITETLKLFYNFLVEGIGDYLFIFNIHYIMAYIVIIVGLKYTDNLQWYKRIYGKYKHNVIAITGVILMFFYSGMSYRIINSEYISSLLQSYILTLVFQDIFLVLFGFLIKKITFNYIKFDHKERSINYVNKKSSTEIVELDKGVDDLGS
jgi:hypothetical protein